jgi:hypothetical protein
MMTLISKETLVGRLHKVVKLHSTVGASLERFQLSTNLAKFSENRWLRLELVV